MVGIGIVILSNKPNMGEIMVGMGIVILSNKPIMGEIMIDKKSGPQKVTRLSI
ncbi:MAG: hypothetical protein ACK5M0_01985 [Bacteroidales bacterium]